MPLLRTANRYKRRSYRTFNFRLQGRYDSSIWVTFCQMRLWDRTVIAELGPAIGSLRILDVGCATGRLLRSLAEAGARELAGADLAPRMVEVARAKLAHCEVVADLRTADAEDSLPWPSGYFDVVTLTGVPHQLYRPQNALPEIHRVLHKAGRVFVVDPCFFVPARQLVNVCLRVFPYHGDHRFYSPRAVAKLLERAGFRRSAPRRVGLWSYFVVGQKGA